VGAMALFVVLSVLVVEGFSLSFTNDIDPDLKISSTLGNHFISPEQGPKSKKIDGVLYSKI
jgi:lipoprotein-releasing system permease protein